VLMSDELINRRNPAAFASVPSNDHSEPNQANAISLVEEFENMPSEVMDKLRSKDFNLFKVDPLALGLPIKVVMQILRDRMNQSKRLRKKNLKETPGFEENSEDTTDMIRKRIRKCFAEIKRIGRRVERIPQLPDSPSLNTDAFKSYDLRLRQVENLIRDKSDTMRVAGETMVLAGIRAKRSKELFNAATRAHALVQQRAGVRSPCPSAPRSNAMSPEDAERFGLTAGALPPLVLKDSNDDGLSTLNLRAPPLLPTRTDRIEQGIAKAESLHQLILERRQKRKRGEGQASISQSDFNL